MGFHARGLGNRDASLTATISFADSKSLELFSTVSLTREFFAPLEIEIGSMLFDDTANANHRGVPARDLSTRAGDSLVEASRISLTTIRRDRGRASRRLEPMLQHIELHLFDPGLNVQSLKQACGIRDNSIAIQFHREMDLAPKAYISQRRMETAARLLIETELRVWKVADLVGYSSLGVFSKAFNRWAGQRPNAYRKQMRGLRGEDVPSTWLQPGLLERAVEGQLSTEEAVWLIRRLLERYPSVQQELRDPV